MEQRNNYFREFLGFSSPSSSFSVLGYDCESSHNSNYVIILTLYFPICVENFFIVLVVILNSSLDEEKVIITRHQGYWVEASCMCGCVCNTLFSAFK